MSTPSIPVSVLPSARFRRRALMAGASAAALAACLVYLKVDPLALFRDFHYLTNLVGQMGPPNLGLLAKPDLWMSMVQTISMAFLGTLAGATCAIVLALLAASNTSPNRWMRLGVRSILAAERDRKSVV